MADVPNIRALLKNVVAYKASDLHLVSKSEPQIRIDGKLVAVNFPKLDGTTIKEMCYSLITDKQKKELEEKKELDFSIMLPEAGRFRVNYYYTIGNELAAAFRTIPLIVPTLEELKSPAIFKAITKRERGLILVTGPTGSGKSTTLAAMLNEINTTENRHIITIEDPIEFVHQNKKSLFSMRGVGEETHSFTSALVHSLREDPDIILVGEMRDRDTMSTAITAAETGHLVLATLHTTSAVQTINRIIDSFEGSEQVQIRNMLSVSLTAVISQALLPRIGGGRMGIFEILITNPAIANLIREDKVHQIYSQMQLNKSHSGMITQTQSMIEALKANLITKDDAIRHSTQVQELLNLLGQ
jgi:twitching motility protein PilT